MMKPISAIVWAATMASIAAANAQGYPSRPITMVVPYAAGGPTDTIARIMAERMRGPLGQTIIVENVTGAAGTIGVGKVARAAPDGYTIGIGHWGTHVVNGAIYALQYDVLSDFEPVAMIATNPQLIVARKGVPAKDLKELVAWLKANSAKATQGTAGHGSASHISGVYLQNITGAQFQFVPYRGAGPAMQDLVAGQIDLACLEAGQTLALYRAGSIKAFGVMNEKRWFAAPDVPAVEEAGLPGVQFPFWHGLWAPKDTPKDVVAKLTAAVVGALADPAVKKRFNELGHDVAAREQQTPAALAAYFKAEIDKWWPIIRAANIKAE